MNKSDNEQNQLEQKGRRIALKTALIGGAAVMAVPEKWVKPVVDSVLLPVHANTTDDIGSQTPEFPIGRKYSLEDYTDKLVPDPASIAMNDSSLLETLIPSAYATLDFSSTTDYFLEGTTLTDFHFTSLRTYNGTSNEYWAGGTLQVGNTSALPTKKNCGAERLYEKNVELVSADENEAVIKVKLIFLDHTIYQYQRTLKIDPSAQAASC